MLKQQLSLELGYQCVKQVYFAILQTASKVGFNLISPRNRIPSSQRYNLSVYFKRFKINLSGYFKTFNNQGAAKKTSENYAQHLKKEMLTLVGFSFLFVIVGGRLSQILLQCWPRRMRKTRCYPCLPQPIPDPISHMAYTVWYLILSTNIQMFHWQCVLSAPFLGCKIIQDSGCTRNY